MLVLLCFLFVLAAPDGWVQIIRGPRPPSVGWPAASEVSGTTKKQGVVGVPRSQARGRWRQTFAQVSSEVSFEAAQRRVAQLESALRALGDARGSEVTVLQESLKVAKRAAQVPLVKVQLAHCEQFVARAEKRLAIDDEERITLVKQLEDGKQRLLKLRESPSHQHQHQFSEQIGEHRLRVCNRWSTLCSRSGILSRRRFRARRQTCRRTESLPDDAHNRELAQDSTSPPCPRWSQESFPQWLEDRQEDLKDAFAREDDVGVLELTSKMAQGAERLIQLTRQPGTTDDELVLR